MGKLLVTVFLEAWNKFRWVSEWKKVWHVEQLDLKDEVVEEEAEADMVLCNCIHLSPKKSKPNTPNQREC